MHHLFYPGAHSPSMCDCPLHASFVLKKIVTALHLVLYLYAHNLNLRGRLYRMWSIWMFTIPSLRAKECTPREKDALNILFVAIPLLNVLLPFIYKSFPFVWAADVLMVGGVYWWKGIWQEVGACMPAFQHLAVVPQFTTSSTDSAHVSGRQSTDGENNRMSVCLLFSTAVHIKRCSYV